MSMRGSYVFAAVLLFAASMRLDAIPLRRAAARSRPRQQEPPLFGAVLRARVAARWTGPAAKAQQRSSELSRAREGGLFAGAGAGAATPAPDVAEQNWERDYKSGFSSLWSLGAPKVELVNVMNSLDLPPGGLTSLVLGSGEGVEVAYLAEHAGPSASATGVDFAATAVAHARETFGQLPGAFFYDSDVCDMPSPAVPVDLIVENTVFQNVRRIDQAHVDCYFEALRRVSTPGRTVLHLNLMNHEAVESSPAFAPCMAHLNLPLIRRAEIEVPFSSDWEVVYVGEGLYELDPQVTPDFFCDAINKFTVSARGKTATGIPSWSMLLLRK